MNLHQSIWLSDRVAPQPAPEPLSERYDVVVVGAGIAGVTTAFNLAGLGFSVALIESRSIFSGVTGNTTGKLTAQHGLIYNRLIGTFGLERARAYAEANQWAIQFVRETSAALNIDCNLAQDDAHVYTTEKSAWKKYEDEQVACADVNLPTALIEGLELPIGRVNAIRMTGQARFHPVKFLRGLIAEAKRKGVHLSENTRAIDIEETASGVKIITNIGDILAQKVVVATHYPIHDSGWFVAKLAPYRSYAMALRLSSPPMQGMYITEDEPMRSMRTHVDETGAYQLVGGEHHKVGQDPESNRRYVTLEKWAREHFAVEQVAYRWSTQDNWTPDELPYVGKSPKRERIWLATGFGGWGMSNGIVAGRLIADQILEKVSGWTDLYDPSRMEVAAVPKIVSENLNVAGHLIGDRLKGVELQGVESLAAGDGGVVQLKDKRVAASRDEEGNLTAVSPVCTHMGCQVAWNPAERSWDCPCHGSRFAADGAVLHGPATKPLEIQNV